MLRETGRKFSNAKEPACTITPVPSHILLRFYGTLSLSVQFLFGCSFVPPQKEEAQAQAQQFSNEGGGPDHGAGAQEVEDHEGGRQQEESAAQGEQGGGASLAQGGEVARPGQW